MEPLQQMNKEKANSIPAPQAGSGTAQAAAGNPQVVAANPQAPTASEGGLQSTQYLNLLERSVRVEEAIKHLRQDFQKSQAAMDKHFSILEWVIGLLFLGLIGLTGVILHFGAALLS